jgi:hypothetical protein
MTGPSDKAIEAAARKMTTFGSYDRPEAPDFHDRASASEMLEAAYPIIRADVLDEAAKTIGEYLADTLEVEYAEDHCRAALGLPVEES